MSETQQPLKRAHDASDETTVSGSAPKRARVSPSPLPTTSPGATPATVSAPVRRTDDLAPNGQARNVTLPLNVVVPPKPPGKDVLRIATWNVASLGAAMKKDFKSYFSKEPADIWILTETKVAAPSLHPLITNRYPYRYWSIHKQPGRAGVAVLSKVKPVSAPVYTIPAPYHPNPDSTRGRIVTLEFERYWLVGTYVVNAGDNLKSMPDKLEWCRAFEKYIHALDAQKPVIWGGDVNCAPTALDLAEASSRWNKRAGHTERETTAWNAILSPAPPARKLVDVWRMLHPELRHYSFWDFRQESRRKGLGWRLDMFILSERLVHSAQADEGALMCEIRDEIWGASDHSPVVLDVNIGDRSEGGQELVAP